MAEYRQGRHSFRLQNPPVITTWASTAGKKESEGPLNSYFDLTFQDTYFGQKTWELAEKHMQQLILNKLISKSGLSTEEIGLVFSGDLLNQCIGSSFSLRNTGIPHLGLYGACSTMAESLLQACGCKVSDLSAVAVAAGPGSFTGVRIGVAAAKGFAWGGELPCYGVSTLEAMAQNLGVYQGYVVPAMDARRNQTYTAVFHAQAGQLTRKMEDCAISFEDLGKFLKKSFL
mgnify:CR=1 FL=1